MTMGQSGARRRIAPLLGHASIQTTGDVYVDYDIEQWAAKLAEAHRSARLEDENS